MTTTNQQRAKKLAERIRKQVVRGAGKGVQAASRFLASRIKETVSEPAPRKAVRAPGVGGNKGAILYYRAATPATPGAPPRKLSGRLRTSVVSTMLNATTARVGVNARVAPSAKYPTGYNYPRHHEMGQSSKLGRGAHPFVLPTITKYRKELRVLVGRPMRIALRGN